MEAASVTGAQVEVLETGTPGRLRTRLLDRLMVRIVRRRGDQLWLIPLIGQVAALENEPITLECTNRRGLLCVSGRAELLESGLIRFHLAAEPELLQRREYVRVRTEQQVSIVGGATRAVARSVNVSGGGMMLRDMYGLELGTRVHFKLELHPGHPPIEGWARVVRIGYKGDRAFEFDEISKRQRERLIHFIFDRQRAALIAARRTDV